jgi:nucleotide-binding universal stress UspA family protein
MPQIVTLRTDSDPNGETIAVVLSQDSVCLGPDGQPWSGVSLNSQEALQLASRLISLALEIEGQKQEDQRTSPRSLVELASILVFHDGSEQGHRAFRLALDLATRSMATIHFAGVFGVQAGRFEPSDLPADYEWQRSWLGRLTQMYSGEAEKEGVELRTTLVAAGDRQAMSELFDSGRFDLIVLPQIVLPQIVLPHKVSSNSNECGTAKALMQSLAKATKSKILFCP